MNLKSVLKFKSVFKNECINIFSNKMSENEFINKVTKSLFNDKFRLMYNLFGYPNLVKVEDKEKTIYIDKKNNNILLMKSFQLNNPNIKVSITPTNL
jgi:hypothetical protein